MSESNQPSNQPPPAEPLESQINRLAAYILAQQGGPEVDEGAVDAAIRIMREQKKRLASATYEEVVEAAKRNRAARLEIEALSREPVVTPEVRGRLREAEGRASASRRALDEALKKLA